MINSVEYEKLKKTSHFENEEDIKYFKINVWKYVEKKDPTNISQLLGLFDDDTEYPDVMYSLVHAIESYEDNDYVLQIIKNINIMNNAPFWLIGIICAILNNEETLNNFKKTCT